MTVCPGPTRIPLMVLSEEQLLFSFLVDDLKAFIEENENRQQE